MIYNDKTLEVISKKIYSNITWNHSLAFITNLRDIMKTVSLINMKGGVGKTTLAVNIADFLAKRHGKRVLIVDVDPQFNATQCILGSERYVTYIKENGYTIVDVFDSSSKATTSVVKGTIDKLPTDLEAITPLESPRGFFCLPSKLDLFQYEMASGQGKELRLKSFLKIKANDYDVCIIDSPPTPSVWMASALLASDYYLIPVKPDPISMTGIDLLEGIVQEKKENYGCTCECCGVVLTMTEANTLVYEQAKEYFQKSTKWKKLLYERTLPKRTKVARGQLNNNYIYDLDDIVLKKEFAGIVQEFVERVGI